MNWLIEKGVLFDIQLIIGMASTLHMLCIGGGRFSNQLLINRARKNL